VALRTPQLAIATTASITFLLPSLAEKFLWDAAAGTAAGAGRGATPLTLTIAGAQARIGTVILTMTGTEETP
jgi:hypothetical protein